MARWRPSFIDETGLNLALTRRYGRRRGIIIKQFFKIGSPGELLSSRCAGVARRTAGALRTLYDQIVNRLAA